MYPQNITVRPKFLFMIYANCGAIAVITSTTYMTIVELFDEYSALFSAEVPYEGSGPRVAYDMI